MIPVPLFDSRTLPLPAYRWPTIGWESHQCLLPCAAALITDDQLREYWDKSAIRNWAARDIVGNRLTMFVVGTIEHYTNVVVRANVDGDYDKRGLPDPLVLTSYFSTYDGRIVQLTVLRNEPDL